MHPEIKTTRSEFWQLFEGAQARVQQLSPAAVDALRNEARKEMNSPMFSLRVAAEIIDSACQMQQAK